MQPDVRRWAFRADASAGIAAAAVVTITIPAAAHHANVIATGSCDGTIAYGVTSWPGVPQDRDTPVDETALSRTNEAIEVSWSADGGESHIVDDGVEHRLAPDNDFTFSGTFTVPRPLPELVTITVVALQPWGNGAQVGEPRTTTVDFSECEGRGSTRGEGRSAGGSDVSPRGDDTESTSFGTTSEAAAGAGTSSSDPLPWVLGGALLAGGAALLVTLRKDRGSRYARPGWW